MNMRKAAQMMKRMGIQQVEIPANQVIIRCDNKEIIIHNPQVSNVNLMGQQTTFDIDDKFDVHTY